jgi:hypothetical protein
VENYIASLRERSKQAGKKKKKEEEEERGEKEDEAVMRVARNEYVNP